MQEVPTETIESPEITPESTTPPAPTPPTPREQAEELRRYKQYLKAQIEELKPQVELKELKARWARAAHDEVAYSLNLQKIRQSIPEKPTQADTDPNPSDQSVESEG